MFLDVLLGAVWTLIAILVGFVIACTLLAARRGPTTDTDEGPGSPEPDPWTEFDMFESNLFDQEKEAQ